MEAVPVALRGPRRYLAKKLPGRIQKEFVVNRVKKNGAPYQLHKGTGKRLLGEVGLGTFPIVSKGVVKYKNDAIRGMHASWAGNLEARKEQAQLADSLRDYHKNYLELAAHAQGLDDAQKGRYLEMAKGYGDTPSVYAGAEEAGLFQRRAPIYNYGPYRTAVKNARAAAQRGKVPTQAQIDKRKEFGDKQRAKKAARERLAKLAKAMLDRSRRPQ